MATATGVTEPEEGLSAMGDVLDISKVEVDELQRSPELLYSVEGFILLYGIHLDLEDKFHFGKSTFYVRYRAQFQIKMTTSDVMLGNGPGKGL